MSYDELIDAMQQPNPPKALAMQALSESREPANALKLFSAASTVRDRTLGTALWWSAGISGVLPCLMSPRCCFCASFKEERFPLEDIIAGIVAIERLGIRHVHLSGGANLDGYDAEAIDMVKAVQAVSDIAIEVNLGPSFSRDGIRQLKMLGVRSVTSSLETVNPDLFAKIKPGDSLEARKRLIATCQEEGMPVRSMVLTGFGETESDRIDLLYYMKCYSCLYQLRFSPFHPVPSGPYRDHPSCSPWEWARIVAVARLLMPHVDLALAMGGTASDLLLWHVAGGGNQLLGAHVSRQAAPMNPRSGEESIRVRERIAVASRMQQQEQCFASLGRKVCRDVPARYSPTTGRRGTG